MEADIGETVIETKFVAALLTFKVAAPWTVLYTAVIVTAPAAVPVAKPPVLTSATFESEELHCAELVTSLVVPFESLAVAMNCCVPAIPIEIEPGVT